MTYPQRPPIRYVLAEMERSVQVLRAVRDRTLIPGRHPVRERRPIIYPPGDYVLLPLPAVRAALQKRPLQSLLRPTDLLLANAGNIDCTTTSSQPTLDVNGGTPGYTYQADRRFDIRKPRPLPQEELTRSLYAMRTIALPPLRSALPPTRRNPLPLPYLPVKSIAQTVQLK